MRAAGVGFVDVLVSEGGYQVKPTLPFVPGSEFAGVIEAVGEGVPPARLGERVAAGSFGGAFAERAVVPAVAARAIPDAMRFAEAAVFRVSYLTAYYALVRRGALKAGENVLVLGAGGAVGYAAVEVARALGGRVIASASSPDKRALALRAGAIAAIDSNAADWREQVKAAAGGTVDIVVDPVGGEASERAFRALGWNGRHLVIGFAAGLTKLPTNLTLVKGAALIGVDIRQYGIIEPDSVAADMTALFALYANGALRPAVAHEFPLDRFAEAMRTARAGQTAGRVVLTMA